MTEPARAGWFCRVWPWRSALDQNARWAWRIWALTLTQLVGGLIFISWPLDASQRPEQPAINAQRIDQVERRLAEVDMLRIDARLTVLERLADDMAWVQRATYGLVVTMLGNLLVSGLLLRQQRLVSPAGMDQLQSTVLRLARALEQQDARILEREP